MTRRLRLASTFAAGLGLTLLASTARAQEGEPPASPAAGHAAERAPQGPSNASDESEDSGLGLEWVYITADAGFTYIDFASLSESSLGLAETSGSGFTWGAGAGVRLFFFSAGARVRETLLSDPGSLWTIDLEAAMHMRIWRIDPYFGLRGGLRVRRVVQLELRHRRPRGWLRPTSASTASTCRRRSASTSTSRACSRSAPRGRAQFLFLQRPQLALPAGRHGLADSPAVPVALPELRVERGLRRQRHGAPRTPLLMGRRVLYPPPVAHRRSMRVFVASLAAFGVVAAFPAAAWAKIIQVSPADGNTAYTKIEGARRRRRGRHRAGHLRLPRVPPGPGAGRRAHHHPRAGPDQPSRLGSAGALVEQRARELHGGRQEPRLLAGLRRHELPHRRHRLPELPRRRLRLRGAPLLRAAPAASSHHAIASSRTTTTA